VRPGPWSAFVYVLIIVLISWGHVVLLPTTTTTTTTTTTNLTTTATILSYSLLSTLYSLLRSVCMGVGGGWSSRGRTDRPEGTQT
jgi:hypothetical protein